jgi:hypothetical protein
VERMGGEPAVRDCDMLAEAHSARTGWMLLLL